MDTQEVLIMQLFMLKEGYPSKAGVNINGAYRVIFHLAFLPILLHHLQIVHHYQKLHGDKLIT